MCVELGRVVTIGGRKRNRMPSWVDIIVVLGNDLDTMVRLGRAPMGRAPRKLAAPLVPQMYIVFKLPLAMFVFSFLRFEVENA